ncbi:MAG: polyprenyl diphosphate synthase [Candidatus Saccharibacteria bacterium]
MSDTNQKTIPTHVGIILDGNRRWAKAKGLSTLEGHLRGAEMIKRIGDAMASRGIKYFTAYTFSTENWSRSKDEVKYLMALILKFLKKDIIDLHKKGIRFRWLGEETNLSKKIISALKDAEELTRNNKKANINLCFNYGGQNEIADACNKLIYRGKSVTTQAISKALYGPDIPPLDLVVRTSGERRLSNFMLWRVAYSELYFTDIMWPDFNETELDKALDDYNLRQRRFGG